MKKILTAVLLSLVLFSLAACSDIEPPMESDPVAQTTDPIETPASPSNLPPVPNTTESDPPELSNSAVIVTDDNAEIEIYRNFLTENYDLISKTTGIFGIGFIDLDLDGIRELLLFDGGASATMGVQLYDILDEEVLYISGNPQLLEHFGDEYHSDIFVNANLSEDFRLMQSTGTQERFFLVDSFNGAIDFNYYELICFGNNDNLVSLDAIAYKYEEIDLDSGDITLARYRLDGEDTDEESYNETLATFFSHNKDTGLESRGAFVWENEVYTNGFDGFLAMLDVAINPELSTD